MASLAKIFGGVLLIVAGIAIIYESNLHHLIELVTIAGFIVVIIGAYLLILSFFERNKASGLQNFEKGINNNSKVKKLDSGLESKNNSLNKDQPDKSTKKENISSSLGSNRTSSKLNSLDAKRITDKVKNVSKNKDPKSVLKPMMPKANENVKKFRFTPNYEKPMKVNRRPQKRISSGLNNNHNNNIHDNNEVRNNLANSNVIPSEKSERIARALASDDFIKPIHVESKPTLDPNVSDSNESDLDKFKPDEISNKINTHHINDDKDVTIDDLENNDLIDKNINSRGINSSSNKSSSKFLTSYVVCSKGTMTSKEAFDELAKNVKSEMSLEMSSIKDMTNEFLSKISSLNVRIIIQEFDIKDMSYILLITSLLEQGVKIRTLPLINTINLIADDSHALIISENDSMNDLDIGAVYNDSKSVSNIKTMFEKSWSIANDLNVNNIGREFS